MRTKIPVLGVKVGRWTVIEEKYSKMRRTQKAVFVKAQCECGRIKEVEWFSLKRGQSTSCGCFREENRKNLRLRHGMTHTRVHKIWTSMIGRCQNSPHKDFKNYAGRGIKVCERWKVFENFLEDMGEPPEGLSIDRINNQGGYEPSNCRWATRDEQQNNRRSNVVVSHMGETLTLKQWSDRIGISYSTLVGRWARGIPLPFLFSKPDKSRRPLVR
jgi:hypothetical protein